MIQLIYASTASKPFSVDELSELLKVARKRNRRYGITGILLYDNGAFLQVLEGEENEVEKLFRRISKDPRHTHIELLLRLEIEHRSFTEWRMGFHEGSIKDLEKHPGFVDFFNSRFPFGHEDLDLAKQALLRFRDGAWHHL
ncbi:MAG: BLUF domain-containing protein [Pyrinomonadaceae bacterium]